MYSYVPSGGLLGMVYGSVLCSERGYRHVHRAKRSSARAFRGSVPGDERFPRGGDWRAHTREGRARLRVTTKILRDAAPEIKVPQKW